MIVYHKPFVSKMVTSVIVLSKVNQKESKDSDVSSVVTLKISRCFFSVKFVVCLVCIRSMQQEFKEGAFPINFEGHQGFGFIPYKTNDIVETKLINIRTKEFTGSAWIYPVEHSTVQLIFGKDRSCDGNSQFRFMWCFDGIIKLEGLNGDFQVKEKLPLSTILRVLTL